MGVWDEAWGSLGLNPSRTKLGGARVHTLVKFGVCV